jgi:hypothetical protein
MIDKLGPYADAGVDRFIMNVNFGAEQSEILDSVQCFAEEVMPHFANKFSRSPVRVREGLPYFPFRYYTQKC